MYREYFIILSLTVHIHSQRRVIATLFLYSRSTFGTSPKGRFLVNGTSPKGDLGLDIWTQKLAGTSPIWEKIGKRD